MTVEISNKPEKDRNESQLEFIRCNQKGPTILVPPSDDAEPAQRLCLSFMPGRSTID